MNTEGKILFNTIEVILESKIKINPVIINFMKCWEYVIGKSFIRMEPQVINNVGWEL